MAKVRQAYHPNQRALGVFVDGLSQTVVQPPRKESVIEMMTPEHRGYAMRDKIPHDEISRTLFQMRGNRVVICPKCAGDVEPDPDKYGGVTFCKCPKCNIGYFVFELIKQGNMRFVSKHEDISSYYLYADAEKVAQLFLDWRDESVPDYDVY